MRRQLNYVASSPVKSLDLVIAYTGRADSFEFIFLDVSMT